MSYGRPQQSKAQNELNAKTLRALVKEPDNKTCADCKRNDPRWASWNIGCYLCIRCSGIHRSMGTHISKVKSIDLDIWTPEQMESIQKWGNKRCNLYWEAHLKAGHVPPDHKIESFIRSKYELRRWAREGPVPSDPASLDPSAAPAPAAAPASTSVASGGGGGAAAAAPAKSTGGGGGIIDLLDDAPPAPASTQQQQTQRPPQPAGATNAGAKAAPAPAQTSAGSGLFDLDWSSAPTTASAARINASTGSGGVTSPTSPASVASPTLASAGGPKGKDDILSLFSAPRPAVAAPAAGPAAAGSNGGFGGLNASFGGMNLGGGSGSNGTSQAAAVGGFDASNPWGAAPAAAAPAPRSNSLFDTQDVWASSTSSATKPAPASGGFGGDIWGSSTSAGATNTTSNNAAGSTAKKDDAFADIWGDFK
ncbi:ARF GAP with effector function(s) [Tilletia horrida]|nr:ARF GAP with effector function(s) [Tilletia horrida]